MHPSKPSTSAVSKCTPITSDDSIVISGIAGKYPRSDSVEHFAENLYNKVDLVDDKEDRWRHLYAGIPKRLGKLNNLGKFDAEFFNSGFQETHTMDPQQRLLLEHCYEALLDAGLHPDDIKGTRTGVFVGVSIAETEIYWTYKKTKSPYNRSILGFVRSMLATKIAYALDLKGPAMAVDTACSSSMYALDWACKAIRQGQCDAAIVAGTNLTLHPYITLQFALLGVLAADGYCRPFDKNASGYSRSEANAVILLQKAKDAKRIYAHVVNTKTNCDGYKLEGITFPSNKVQKQLLDELYSEVPYDPKDISYVEAHSTGTVVGDPEECDAIEKVFCPDRTEPLLVGSVKSNIGHSEAAAGICSVTKCIIAMQNCIIPPNINYTEPRTDVPSLLNGKLKVVDQSTPLVGPLVAVNSFGFGGANAHALLHNCTKPKINGGCPMDALPRLVIWSGRTIAAVDNFLDSLAGKGYDAELYALTHNIQRKEIPKMTTKGYVIFGGRKDGNAVQLYKAVSTTIPKKYKIPSLTLVFGPLENNWKSTVDAFKQFPEFATSTKECLHAIRECGFDAFDHTMQTDDPIHRILWTFITQVGVYRVLAKCGLSFDQYAGYAAGQITCAHLDGVLSLQDALRVAYAQGYIIRAHHTEKSSSSSIASNKPLNVKLAAALKPLRLQAASPKWFNPCQLKTFDMYDPKVTASLLKTLGNETIILQPLNDSVKTPNEVVISFLKTLGEVFQKGHQINLLSLYPSVEFPVSQGTSMISSLLEWDHSADWHVTNFRTTRMVDQSTTEYTISLSEQDYIAGHCIDGRILIPATGYLFYVWDSFSGKMGIIPEEMPVEFSDIEFLRATTLVGDQQVTLTVDLNEITGHFEVREGTALVVTGRIQALTNYKPPVIEHKKSSAVMLPSKDFYKELRLRGYHYGGFFRSVLESAADGSYAKIEWKFNWTALLDCILQVAIIAVDSRSLVIPTRIDSIKIDPIQHKGTDQSLGNEVPSYNVRFDPELNLLQCGAIEIRGLNASTIARRLPPGVPVLESYKFQPYYPQNTVQPATAVSTIVQTILENQATILFSVTEIHSKTRDPIISLFGDAIGDLPLVKAHLTLLSTAKPEPIPNVTISEDKLMKQRNVLLLICENLFNDDEFISDAINSLSDQGFILLREAEGYRLQDSHRRLQLVSTIPIEGETYLLLQQKKSAMSTSVDSHVIKISSNDTTHNWLLELKQEVKTKPIILYAQNDPSSGIIGLVNCIRKEPSVQTVSCFFIDDPNAPPFDASNAFYKDQIELGLAINVYRNGQWGSYRHFKLLEEPRYESTTNHCFANCVKPGDLSSFTWMVGPLSEQPPSSPLVRVVYSSLNFKDVMIATGRLTIETFCTDRLQQECILGFEYSGVTATGKRVMGIIPAGSMATIIEADSLFTLDVPDECTLEQAATIPTVYATVYAAFFICSHIRKGNSILIHAGTGGIGLAAIRVCLAYGLEVFTTVSTKEKREFLLSYFPELNPNNIGNSRDISFETLIKERTNGRGVDFVLNSLSEEKLQASIRCLAKGGHFLEIGNVCSPAWIKIASEINAPTFMLQTFANATDEQTIPGIVDTVFDEMFETVFAKAEQFLVIGYSFGSLLALEIVKRLEARSLRGKLMLIDGSPLYLQRFASHHLSGFDDEHLQMAILTLVLSFALPSVSNEIVSTIMSEATYENRVSKMLDIGRESNPFSEDYTRKMMRVLFYRLKAAMNMSTDVKEKLVSSLVLVRSGTISEIEEDYGLSEFTHAFAYAMKTVNCSAIEPIESESSIVISGIAGKYPRSDNVQEFADNLFNKVDLVDDKEDRWRHTHPDIPKRLGKLNNLEKFDADLFGYSLQDAHTMDPQHRLLLEHCYEAVLDAGLHLDDLRGTKTGVFIGCSFSENETYWTYKKTRMPYKKLMLGFTRSMLALKVAYALDLKGPAMTMDTACSSSMYALDWACKAIRQGQCDAAIVAGTNLTLHPYITLQFALLGVLAADGYCRPFDKNASGYSRSEANAVILLQKAKDAKRIYAHVVNTKTNCDGYKLEGITFPSNKVQKQLLDELYSEVPYDPKDISYVEAHSTGTVVGDPEECDAIEKVFCPNRNRPLLVGSVKSNIGHSEPAAGICSITKCIIAIQTNLIPPNIHYTEPRKDVPALLNGQLKVVDEVTPLDGPLVAVNSFGFGGANAHALLHAYTGKKVSSDQPFDELPRLVVWSGRTIEAVDHFLEGIAKHNFDPELYALTHNIQRKGHAKMNNRGYAILTRRDDGPLLLCRRISKARKVLPKFAIVFGQMDYDWQTTLRAFKKFPLFKSSVEQCLSLLRLRSMSTFQGSKSDHQRTVWTLIVQISVYHTLKASGLVDQYGGYSIGQITCAYIDGVLSLSDAIRVAFTHGVLLGAYPNPETFNYRDIITDKDLNAKLASVLQSFLFRPTSGKLLPPCCFRIYDPKTSAKIFNTIDSDAIVLQPLPSIQSTDNIVKSFLSTIGRAFVDGQHCQLLDLYPKVTFPVSLETPMIGPLIQWDHSVDWHVANFRTKKLVGQVSNHYTVSLAEQEYIAGHCIDGRVLIPATEYLYIVWDSFTSKTGTIPNEVTVEFTEIEFLRATTITSNQVITLLVEINDISGHFEVTEGSTLVVKGCIQRLNQFKLRPIQQRTTQAVTLPTKDFYKELRLRGYHYGGFFKSVMESASDGSLAKIEWKDNWTALLDCMLQVAITAVDSRSLVIPTRIDSIKIDPIQQK
uniref:Uncharacterized protein n=1 Tax=Anopheles funestus TaxID=62324 RepID=A0A182RRM2_ANOFN